MKILERKVENLQTRGQFIPATLNEENRTVDVVFATELPVRMFSWEDGLVDEILSCEPGHVQTERLNAGIPVLDNHDRSKGTKGQLAIVENWRFEGGKGYATLRFSKRASVEETWQDVKDGILRGISVGYTVHKYEITRIDGQRPQYRAVDWEPLEISFAPVQADYQSSVRTQTQTLENINKQTMDLKARALAVNLPETATLLEVERAESDARTRKENEIRTQAAKEAADIERKRSSDIIEAVRAAGLKTEFAAKLISDGKDIHQSRELIINELATQSPEISGQNRSITFGAEQRDKVREGMENALEHRANPGAVQLNDKGREFRGMGLMEMARECVEQSGQSTRGMSKRKLAEVALNSARGYNSTSDFPNILSNVVNKVLRKEYDAMPATFKAWTSQGSFTDFKEKTVTQLGDAPMMEEIKEGGEYTFGTFGDAKESYRAVKYGKIIPITWEALINDDLSAFNRVPKSIAMKAKLLQNQIVYSILNANAAMGDNVALFHANHNNLIGAGTAINVASLQASREKLRTMKATDNETILNLIPKFIVAGTAHELTAYQYTSSSFTPTKNSDQNPVYNSQLQPIIDPRISGTPWYLIADPAQIDTIEYSFLDGEGELFTEQRVGFEVDGLQIKARMVFGAKAIDWRGMIKNPGA